MQDREIVTQRHWEDDENGGVKPVDIEYVVKENILGDEVLIPVAKKVEEKKEEKEL